MAVLSTIKCDTCNEKKEVMHRPGTHPTTCGACKKKKADAERTAHLDALAKLPIEERLRKLEEFQYDHLKNHPRQEVTY